jgi:phospholipase A-2-activating protein
MIWEADDSVCAYQWSIAEQQWIKIGVVVDSAASNGRNTSYLGKDYDFVFDVDIAEGQPPLKLPYNLGQNEYEAAQKFIEDNELPIGYLDQVAEFIVKNTKGATLGAETQAPQTRGSDPWGSENRYRPGGEAAAARPAAPPTPKVLPQREYLSILVARVDSMQKKIEELNHELIAAGRKDVSLNPTEIGILRSLRTHIEKSGSTATSQSIAGGLDLAVKLATEWPYKNRLPGLDLLRLLCVAPETATYRDAHGKNLVEILERSLNEQTPPAENNVMLAVRGFGNLFASLEGRALALEEIDRITSITASALKDSTHNRNLLVAAVTLAINYAVLFSQDTTGEIGENAKFEGSVAWLEVLAEILNEQKDAEVLYRALVAAGTFLEVAPEVKSAAQEVYGVGVAVKNAVEKSVDPRIKNLGREIAVLLK